MSDHEPPAVVLGPAPVVMPKPMLGQCAAVVAWVVYQFGDGVQTHVLGSFATDRLGNAAAWGHISLLRRVARWSATEWFDGAEWHPCPPLGQPTHRVRGCGWSDGLQHIRMVRTEVQGG